MKSPKMLTQRKHDAELVIANLHDQLSSPHWDGAGRQLTVSEAIGFFRFIVP